MDPLIWGPTMWNCMFKTALKCEGHIPEFISILHNLRKIIPCSHCRNSYCAFVTKLCPKTTVSSAETAMEWVWTIHDMVNQKLGKQCIAYSIAKQRLMTDLGGSHASVCAPPLAYMLYQLDEPEHTAETLTCIQEIASALAKIHGGPLPSGNTYTQIENYVCSLCNVQDIPLFKSQYTHSRITKVKTTRQRRSTHRKINI